MLEKPFHSLLTASVFLGAFSIAAHDAEAHKHRHYRYRYSSHPYVHLSYAAGFYRAPGFGFGYYPFSIGLAYAGAPKDPRGDLKTLVFPKDTEVFIDGYYAGIADDFDGTKELHLEPGPHVVTLYREGHRLFEETIYSSPGSTVRLRHVMEPLDPGEPAPPRPGSSVSPPPAPPSASATEPAQGTLVLRSEPRGVEVWIDGELFRFPAGSERMTAHLLPGKHRLELKKEGYQDFAIEVEVFSGETSALNVRLVPLR